MEFLKFSLSGFDDFLLRPIVPAEVDVLRIMPVAVGFLVAAGLLVAVLGRRWLLGVWLAAFGVLGAAGLIELWSWKYEYGHNLDPRAAIRVPGMTYQPPFIGSKTMLNITATSYPSWGTLLVALSFGIGLGALVYEMRRRRRQLRRLPDNWIAAHKRNRRIPSPHGHRKVERRYAADWPQRMPLLEHAVIWPLAGDRQPVELTAQSDGEVADVDHLLHFAQRLLRGETCVIYGDGGQTRDFVYVGDVVDAFLAALERGTGETFHVGTAAETSVAIPTTRGGVIAWPGFRSFFSMKRRNAGSWSAMRVTLRGVPMGHVRRLSRWRGAIVPSTEGIGSPCGS